jgi:hypothetical protein
VCLPLLEFLQVASTQPTAGNHSPPSLQDWLGKVHYPVRPTVTNERRTTVLYHLLPALAPTNQGHLPDTFAETLADSLTNITVEMHANHHSRETRVSESTRSKTFREKYGDHITDGILLLTSSSEDDPLPLFYQELGGKQNG